MNNKERADWVNNDEGLYRWKRGSRQPMAEFIRDNRTEIDAYIAHEQHRHNGRGGSNCAPGCPYYAATHGRITR